MPWPLRMVEYAPGRDWEPGDCCYVPRDEIGQRESDGRYYVWGQELSDEYVAQRMASRPPVAVYTPDGWLFVVDGNATSGAGGWTVSGEPPNLTVTPSINIVGCYHGWITNGVLTDDCDGRQFERVPRPDGEGFWWRVKR